MSEPNVSQDFKRRAFARDDGNGKSVTEWTLTPVSLADPVQVIAQPICTVPIVFVPGIMGSNLKVTQDAGGIKKDQPVWLMNSEAGAAADWLWRQPDTRQLRLNPATTAVFADGDVPSYIPTIGDATAIRKTRYWGEVASMSYQGFLVWLEATLNERKRTTQWRGELGLRPYGAQALPGNPFKPLSEDAVVHAASIRFPVYACGYNWLRSNIDSAGQLARRIDEVIQKNNSPSFTCEQVILVTHSMGGLVARACSELIGMRSKIAGIVHGVMPATGAAVAYRRVRAGTEGGAGLVLGDDAAKMTAVFANSPGALQLLPNSAYGKGWLKLGTGIGTAFKEVVSLPKSDPYEEIYKQRGPWWALVREELINPAVMDGHLGWRNYIGNVGKARDFHAQLDNKYHPNTYSFHGDGRGDKGLTWGEVKWQAYSATQVPAVWGQAQTTAQLLSAVQAPSLVSAPKNFDSGEGRVGVSVPGINLLLDVSGKDSAGDGTVPVVSGAAAAQFGCKTAYHVNLDEEGHEGAYRNATARALTLHAILSIASTVPIKE